MITEAGELLLRRGLITAEQLVQSRANLNGNGILESIIESGFAREEDALKAIAEEFGLDYIDLRETNVDLSLLATFPQKLIYRHPESNPTDFLDSLHSRSFLAVLSKLHPVERRVRRHRLRCCFPHYPQGSSVDLQIATTYSLSTCSRPILYCGSCSEHSPSCGRAS